jgi:chromosome segregation ATPase
MRRSIHLTGLAAGAVALLLVLPAQAQQRGPGGGPQSGGSPMSQQSSELQQAQEKARKLQQQLSEIQQKALKNNPELQDELDELKALVQQKMKDKGHTPEKDRKRIEKLRGDLTSGDDMSQKQRQSRMQEFRKLTQGLQKAQKEAMQDPEVKEKTKQFRESMRAAMKEENPEAPQLRKELQKTVKKMRQMMQQRGGAHGGGQGAPSAQ